MFGKTLKCQSCGSSALSKLDHHRVECEHCGTILMVNTGLKGTASDKKMSMNVVIISGVVLIGITLLRIIIDASSVAPIEKNQPQTLLKTVNVNQPNTVNEIKHLLKENTGPSAVPEQQQQKPQVSIVSEKKGSTISGGVYWIVKIRNDSAFDVKRAKVVISLFDQSGQRVDEQSGWLKRELLKSSQEGVVLVYIADPPEHSYTVEMMAQAKNLGHSIMPEVMMSIENFVVKEKTHQRYEIIGDVYNPYDFQVNFVKVVALALDANQQPVGIADAYVTSTNVGSKQQAGFKVRAGTFLLEQPDSWSLWAKGQAQKK